MGERFFIFFSLFFLLSCSSDRVYIWQGFDATWLRRLGGFETPHRLGPFQNEIVPSGKNGHIANLTFCPGVDGDYAYPRLYFQELALHDPSFLVDDSHEIQFHFSDKCVTDRFGDPVASTILNSNLSLAVPPSASVALLLSGVDMQMWCDPKLQPPGHKCNSNGIWPYEIVFDILKCMLIDAKLSCDFVLEVRRGWTPSGGGGRPLDQVMSYSIRIPLLLLQSSGDRFGFVSGERLVRIGNTHGPTINGTAVFVPVDPGDARSMNLPVLAVGLSGFGFRMLETLNRTRLGRYLESLVFRVSQVREEGTEFVFDYAMDYGSAKSTTYSSDVELWLHPALLKFSRDTASVSGSGKFVSCPVCFSADVFSCQMHHLKNDIHCATEIPKT